MDKKLFMILGIMGMFFSSCTKKENVIKIGLVAPMTGGAATYGTSTKNGCMMAIDEINRQGGLIVDKTAYKINCIWEDDEGKPESAANAYRKLIDQNKVIAIIGTVMSKCSLAGAPIAQESGVPMITPASTNPQVTEVGNYIFRACFIDPFQGTVMANFAYNTLGKRKAAVLFDNGNDYNKGLAEFFKAQFENLGGKVVAYESFTDEDKTQDFTPQLTKIKAVSPDVLFLPNYYSSVALVVKQAKGMQLNIPFLGGDGWDSPELINLAGKDIEGSYFSTHFSKDSPLKEIQKFVKEYEAKYGFSPDGLAALGYDATYILCNALKRSITLKKEDIRQALVETKDLQVLSGKITFDSSRNPIKNAVILKIENGRTLYYSTIAP